MNVTDFSGKTFKQRRRRHMPLFPVPVVPNRAKDGEGYAFVTKESKPYSDEM